MRLAIFSLLLTLAAALCPTAARAERNQFADEASQRAYAAVFAIDNKAFAEAVAHVGDKAKASFLKEYMALMNYTAANSRKNYDAYIAASDRAFDDAAGSRYEANLLCQLHIHKCMVYMYNGSMAGGGLQFWKAYRQFKAGEKKYAAYDGQLVFRGIYNVLLSQIPEKWKSLAGFLGFSDGNLALGFKQIEQYRQSVKGYKGLCDEALVFSFANMFFSHDQNLTATLTQDIKKNPTAVVRYAYVLSCGRRQMGEEAEKTLRETPDAVKDRFPLLYHQMGKYALRRESPDETIRWATKFLQMYNGVTNKNSAYLEMAQAYLLKGNRAKADEMAKKCMAIKSDFDIDRRAIDGAMIVMQTNLTMLRATLQFEYGRFAQSIATLKSLTPTQEQMPEYHFRLGRAEEKLGNRKAAIDYYSKTIAMSGNSTRYFGPYSAVYAADLQLAAGDTASAQRFISQAKKLNNGEYQKELDQRIELTNRAIKGKR